MTLFSKSQKNDKCLGLPPTSYGPEHKHQHNTLLVPFSSKLFLELTLLAYRYVTSLMLMQQV